MGEVYRARDTRLERTVAIKVAGENFSDRFEREARSIAALSHSNICTLYDVGPNFLVMEYIEGETLEARMQKGALPVREALQYAVQIVAALDAAHRRGIVHRDLKPANIMLSKSGVKLLDFGLAKTQAAVSGSEGETQVTTEKTIVGTLQYMSPELLEGKEADARSDIFAFGLILYEMLAGRKAFTGASQATLIAAIMSSEPEPFLAPEITNLPALDRVVKRCLSKPPDDRWQCAHDLREELQWIADGGAAPPAPAVGLKRQFLPWILAASFAVAVVVLATVHLRERPEPQIPARFSVSVPEGRIFAWYDGPAISPDGERLVFAASEPGGQPMLFLRSLRSTGIQPIAGTDGAYFPFWSPDSKHVAFFSLLDRKLKRVDLAGGAPQIICELPPSGEGRGGAWLPDGFIVFGWAQKSLQRVSAEGGDPKEQLPLSDWEHEHRRPQILPDGGLLFHVESSKPELVGTHVLDLGSKQRKRIFEGYGQYAAGGYLLFVRGDTLAARRVDLKDGTLTGDTLQIARQVYLSPVSASLSGSFSASPAGVLCFRTGTGSEDSQFIVFSRDGRKLKALGERGLYTNPAISADGKMLAYGKLDPKLKTRDLWVLDIQRNTPTRLTSDPADDLNPVWSPDGRWVYFTSDRKGARQLYRKPASGVGEDELIFASEDRKSLEDITPDGRTLIFNLQRKGPAEIYALSIENPAQPVPVIESQFGADQAQVSPNGRWMAYRSSESGRQEVYVQTFSLDPKRPRGKWRISTSGGLEPRWRPDGKELFYIDQNTIFAVDVTTGGPAFEAGVPKRLFPAALGPALRNRYLITTSGDILFNTVHDEAATAPIEVIVNWSPVRR